MGERTTHPPGTFSWTDLSTTDPEGAKAFYTGLFGWDVEDNPLPEGGTYTMVLRDGKYAGALSAGMEGQPTAWNSYVTVDSADAAAASAQEYGGTLAMEPFDVLDAGRMALIEDPTGAFLAAWEPRGSIGAQVVNEPGALTLNQLNTSDPERAREFYANLFGWRFEDVEGGDQPYWSIYNADRQNGGMMTLPPEAGMPSHWLVYFGSASVDDDAGRVSELGGTVMVPPMPIPSGRILVAHDPQGGVFALFSGEFDR